MTDEYYLDLVAGDFLSALSSVPAALDYKITCHLRDSTNTMLLTMKP
jgi:hypothetical protein